MKILITAGSTQIPIDQVRCISNIFKGRTGTEIAVEAVQRGHKVTLLTSNPDLAYDNDIDRNGSYKSMASLSNIISYKTYDQLLHDMEFEITKNKYDIIIHSSAVSDYYVEGTYWMQDEISNCDSIVCDGEISAQVLGGRIDSSKKISSDNRELFLRLLPTEKIIDKIRSPWGFKGKLVKFKLQVGIDDDKLIHIAGRSMKNSQADIAVANCLEWSKERAFIIAANELWNCDPLSDEFVSTNVNRRELASKLLDRLEEPEQYYR